MWRVHLPSGNESLRWMWRLLGVLAAGGLVAIWLWLSNAETRALAAMDADLRRELFVRTRAEADVLCARVELKGECQDRLEFLARFPECDESCREFILRVRPGPTR
jgi:cytochrome b pre-mRNA-processing protein 3